MAEEAVITRVYDRHGCLYVEGVVIRNGEVLKAKFTCAKSDIIEMNREQFTAWATKQLPSVTVDKKWAPPGGVLV